MSYHRHDPDDMSEFERQFDDVHDPFLDDDRWTRPRPFDDVDTDAGTHTGTHADTEFGDEFDPDDDDGYQPVRRSRAVRWTAILIVASFAAGALSSVVRWL